MRRFLIDANYGRALAAKGISPAAVLERALLPQTLLNGDAPAMTAAEYFRFMRAIDDLVPDNRVPVELATANGIEALTPPLFAAYCSPNGLAYLQRLARYKPLVGALIYDIIEDSSTVSVILRSTEPELELPEILIGIEFSFIVGMLRKATSTRIVPLQVVVNRPLRNHAYADYLGIEPDTGPMNALVFSKRNMLQPFISRNDSMWECIEPELTRRLAAHETDDSVAAQVRSLLMELLPAGDCTIENVASHLGYSKRSLQRKLQQEDTSFQKQLNHTRELLARYYVGKTTMRAADIAYLLGYRDESSFLRAFALWTGQTISAYRRKVTSGDIPPQ